VVNALHLAGDRLLAIVGTDTEVGKTWFSAGLIRELRRRNLRVAARKPVQSFDPTDTGPLDADVLGEASGELPGVVCPEERGYPVAMAPPMAADALGRPTFSTEDLLAGIEWPTDADLCLLETVGGVRSPISSNGDSADLVRHLAPTNCILVADAGLGTINRVRLSLAALSACVPATSRILVFLNRFDESDLHRRNLNWLGKKDGIPVCTTINAAADWLEGADLPEESDLPELSGLLEGSQ
jgi:dethiobiotin synthetase